MPTPGYDNRFGLHYQQGYFWAINPSQDFTISPSYYSNLGYGSDFEYRYVLDRKSRGQWFVSYLQQTAVTECVRRRSDRGGCTERLRALITGTHTQQFTPDLLIRVNANLVTDPELSAAAQQLRRPARFAE